MLAANRAGDTALASPRARGAQFFRRQGGGPLERAALEVARRQRAEAIERQHVGRGAELAVLRRGRTKGALGQIAAQLGDAGWIGPLDALLAAYRDRLDVLAAKDGAAAAAAGVSAVVRDRRVADTAFPG